MDLKQFFIYLKTKYKIFKIFLKKYFDKQNFSFGLLCLTFKYTKTL